MRRRRLLALTRTRCGNSGDAFSHPSLGVPGWEPSPPDARVENNGRAKAERAATAFRDDPVRLECVSVPPCVCRVCRALQQLRHAQPPAAEARHAHIAVGRPAKRRGARRRHRPRTGVCAHEGGRCGSTGLLATHAQQRHQAQPEGEHTRSESKIRGRTPALWLTLVGRCSVGRERPASGARLLASHHRGRRSGGKRAGSGGGTPSAHEAPHRCIGALSKGSGGMEAQDTSPL